MFGTLLATAALGVGGHEPLLQAELDVAQAPLEVRETSLEARMLEAKVVAEKEESRPLRGVKEKLTVGSGEPWILKPDQLRFRTTLDELTGRTSTHPADLDEIVEVRLQWTLSSAKAVLSISL